MAYTRGSAAQFARDVLNNPQKFHTDATIGGDIKTWLGAQICWNSVIYCLKAVSNKKFFSHKRATLADENDAKRYLFPTGYYPPVKRPVLIREDCVVGIFRQRGTKLSHVMISIADGGRCIGSNNGAVGGLPNWAEVNLALNLQWDPLGIANPTFTDRAGTDERIVLINPVINLLGNL